MTDVIMPQTDGLFGGGSGGGGLVGGLILGSLLRNNGNLFGGGEAAATGGVATQMGVQTVVNQSAIQQELADIKASIPFNEAQVQLALAGVQTALTSNITAAASASAAQSAQTQLITQAGFTALNQNMNAGFADVANHLNDIEVDAQKNKYELAQAVVTDGDRTRSLITAQYEATLNRQLSEANNALAELRGRHHVDSTARGIEVNTTNNINQMQAQQQQQQQFQALAGIVSNLANDLQYIRATNQAINIGSGVQTANPQNTNTNVRA